MNLHTADIAARLRRFLDRRQCPKRVEGKSQAEADEVAALVGVVERSAPRGADAVAAWWPRFEAILGETGTGLWPTEKEVREAAVRATKETPSIRKFEEIDWYAKTAEKMAAGEAVGENYLYGREAVELIRRKLVDEETMRKYRSAAFFARKDTQGEASALRWEAEAKERHEAAKLMLHDTDRKRRNLSDILKGFAA